MRASRKDLGDRQQELERGMRSERRWKLAWQLLIFGGPVLTRSCWIKPSGNASAGGRELAHGRDVHQRVKGQWKYLSATRMDGAKYHIYLAVPQSNKFTALPRKVNMQTLRLGYFIK